MRYKNIIRGKFIDRPNRFIAHIEINGNTETVHVKNTGRCAELLRPGAEVYVQKPENSRRKTKWDLIGVKKGKRMINMDSQAPNKAVKEWLEKGNLFEDISLLKQEYTYGNSRFDLYVETKGKKAFIEVKGVTLEEDGIVRFPDAPSERAVKHVKELKEAVREGYEAYVFFVIQMEGARYFTPNTDTHPAFGEALKEAAEGGVKLLAYDCHVTEDSIEIEDKVPVILSEPVLYEAGELLIKWYCSNKRDLPWRQDKEPYHIWVSEIMLQQTRVEAVKPYYERFLSVLPSVKELAEAEEEQILKLWEGLGYYNRVRNMQKAARQIMVDYNGVFPDTYEAICSLKGIGSYTAGAVSSIAYGLPKAAVDGNVLRVITRLTADNADITKQSTKNKIERKIEMIMPEFSPGELNQSLIELGAIVCVPNGEPKCRECPLSLLCRAYIENRISEFPVKPKGKERRIEEKTVLVFRDGEKIAISKRENKGLLAGLYELPNLPGHMDQDEVTEYSRQIGLMPIHIKELGSAKHIFSHVEWHMSAFEIKVDELEKTNKKEFLFIYPQELKEVYPIPSAFEKYVKRYICK